MTPVIQNKTRCNIDERTIIKKISICNKKLPVIFAGFFGFWVHQMFGGPIFKGWNKSLTLGKALKFGGKFFRPRTPYEAAPKSVPPNRNPGYATVLWIVQKLVPGLESSVIIQIPTCEKWLYELLKFSKRTSPATLPTVYFRNSTLFKRLKLSSLPLQRANFIPPEGVIVSSNNWSISNFSYRILLNSIKNEQKQERIWWKQNCFIDKKKLS